MMNSTIMWVFVSVSAFGVFFILLVIMILQLKKMMNCPPWLLLKQLRGELGS